MVKGHHVQLRCHSLLFCDFKEFNIKVVMAHHPSIQEDMDELLVNGFIEPSAGGASFMSNVFVILKCSGGL